MFKQCTYCGGYGHLAHACPLRPLDARTLVRATLEEAGQKVLASVKDPTLATYLYYQILRVDPDGIVASVAPADPVALVKWQLGGNVAHIVGEVKHGDVLYAGPVAVAQVHDEAREQTLIAAYDAWSKDHLTMDGYHVFTPFDAFKAGYALREGK